MGSFVSKYLNRNYLFRKKFLIVSIFFLVHIAFIDSNNLLIRFNDVRYLNQLKTDKEYYINKINNDTQRMNELKTNINNLEKFAREQYFMKNKDEDIYIIIREDDFKKINE